MRIIPVLLAVVVWLLQPAATAAQALTGSLNGTVRDEQGGAIVGAEVRASSPSLIGGVALWTTDARGQFRFPALTPGWYTLEIRIPKFEPYRETDIRIALDAAIETNPVLKLASLTTAVTVAGSRIDTREPGFATRIDAGTLSDTPTRRNNLFAFIMMAPGVSPTSQATSFRFCVRLGCRPEHRSGDGTNITSTSNGVAAHRTGHRLHSGDPGSISRSVRRVRQRSGRGDRHHHATGQQPLSVGRFVLRTAARSDQSADRRPINGAGRTERLRAAPLLRCHDDAWRSDVSRPPLVLCRLPVPARRRQSAWRRSGLSEEVQPTEDLRQADVAARAGLAADAEPPPRIMGQPGAADRDEDWSRPRNACRPRCRP